jgi:hypothetical protein
MYPPESQTPTFNIFFLLFLFSEPQTKQGLRLDSVEGDGRTRWNKNDRSVIVLQLGCGPELGELRKSYAWETFRFGRPRLTDEVNAGDSFAIRLTSV